MNFSQLRATNIIEKGDKVPEINKREEENMIDLAIINRFNNGEAEAFYELVNRYKQTVCNMANKFINNKHEAEDMSQEVFFQLYKALPGFKGESRFFTWFFRLITNVCLYYKRSKKDLQKTISFDASYMSMSDERLGPEAISEKKDMSEKINKAIGKLPEELRITLVFREIEGLTYEEISAILKISAGTVKSRIHNARVMLGEIIQKEL